jgi:hypothetical protein
MAVDLDDGSINHGVLHVRFIRASLEKPNENIGFDPIAVSLENRVPAPEEGWKIAPRTSCPHDPKQGFDEAAIVATTSSRIGWFTQTMRFHLRPLGVRQHKSFHPKLESQSKLMGNPESQQTLEPGSLSRLL